MKINLEVYDAKKCVPVKSGMYLTMTGSCDWTTLQWSVNHHAWNASDLLDEAEHAMDVIYWTEIPEVEV